MGYRDSQRFRKVYGYYRPLPRATDTSLTAAQEYVDDVVAGIDWKQSVRVASVLNVNISAPGNIDDVALADEDRVLLKNQSNAAENGIYIFYTVTGTLTRTKDAEQDTLTSGAAVYVEEGTENNGTAWILSTPDPITVGTTNQTWVIFSTIYPVFVKSGSYARSTVNVSFGNDYADEIGSNVFFYVSGTIGSATSPQISVFGGDIFASGSLTVRQGLSGSLTKLADGTSYLIAGTNITLSSASNGSVTISSTASGGGGGDVNAEYLVLSTTGSLSSERRLVSGLGINSVDGGAGGDYTLTIDNSVVATVSGTTFTGATKHSAGLSGSLTNLADGSSYLIAGSNVTITSASNGAVTIAASGTAPGGIDTQVQFNDGGSALGGDAGLTYSKMTDTLNVVNISMTATNDQVLSLKDNSAEALNISAGTGNNRWTFNTGDNQERLGFRDGVRASFGDINDPDLNIQHDGTNSLITNKTGLLIISGAVGIIFTGSISAGSGSNASGIFSHAEGRSSIASGIYSHAEGWASTSSGQYSHAEGTSTIASGIYSHAEGNDTESSNEGSHAEGDRTLASGQYAHAEGLLTIAAGDYSHAEGSQTISSGSYSHAVGDSTISYGDYSLAAGIATIASGSGQLTVGQYNERNNNFSLFVVGDGTGDSNMSRHDVFRVNTGIVEVTGSLGMKGAILPDSDVTYNLGSSSRRWANIYTGDLHLRNDRGDYTLIEEEEFLSIRFNKTGKRYKFLLERVPELDEE